MRIYPAYVQFALRLLRYHQFMRKYARSAATAVLMTAGLSLVGLGAATAAQAAPLPNYYQGCPGHPHWTYSHCLAARR
jgi:hypothetical protein